MWKSWILVPVLYGAFSLWYFNWRAPLNQAEVESYMQQFSGMQGVRHTDPAVFRNFLEQDDGREFVMVNLVEFHSGEIAHPVTGEKMTAQKLVGEYFRPFSLALIRKGGHPVYQARTVGGNVDSWNADNNVGFGTTAMMRYRSRRDLVELVMDPAFTDSHVYKLAAIERTISFPTHTVLSVSMRPPAVVLLTLLLLASIAQNVAFYRRQ